VDGAQSLGELDFAALCRSHGLPEPDRQVVRRGPRGRIYLDVRWSAIGLVVEIDGSQHRMGLAVTDDNLRQNEVTLSADRVLRVDLVGLRLRPEAFMAQIVRAHAQLGR
jgi:very-short-patch-repair endonuclease